MSTMMHSHDHYSDLPAKNTLTRLAVVLFLIFRHDIFCTISFFVPYLTGTFAIYSRRLVQVRGRETKIIKFGTH